jgi:squalene-hopene/tetraprenyl-beta-curcumene cyclase
VGLSQDTRQIGLATRAADALDRAVEALLAKQHAARPWGAALERGDGRAGHWCAELEGDSILSSEYLLMKWILGQESDTEGRACRRTLERIANHLRLTQRTTGAGAGGWGQYPGSPPDLSATVKAYFALKLMGDPIAAPHMVRARDLVLRLGGAERINTFSMFYLACLGQVSWDACPAIPPQIALLPRWFPFHMDKVAAWTRTMILPLAICSALRPVRRLPVHLGIDELFIDPDSRRRLNKDWDREEPGSWTNLFLVIDRLLKAADRAGLMPLRHAGLKAAERWILQRMDPATTEGLGAIFPPMVYVQIAFKALGYPRSHPVIRAAEAELDAFMIDAPPPAHRPDPRLDHVRLQPCFSPVWDTGIALYALTEAGLTCANSPAVVRCCRWLLDRQVRRNGDWERNLRRQDRGLRLGENAAAWAFEYRNDWYPDVDDTAMVAKALWRAAAAPADGPNGAAGPRPAPRHESADADAAAAAIARECRAAARLACRWLLAMQNDDGGWAAFDRTKDRPWMEKIPFADHNAMQDPSCADITGRVIEALITCGVPPDHEAIQRAIAYDLSHQHADGCWWGRWGVNYLYGTWQALGGLTIAGVPREHPALRRALAWLRSVQNADGGFGESANSYLDPLPPAPPTAGSHAAGEPLADLAGACPPGRGPSTASQTAWGLMSLLYLVPPTDRAVERAVAWLCDHQLAADKAPFEPARLADPSAHDPGSGELAATDFVSDRAGAWNEHWFTGTGFPKVFYLRYHLYRHYFPVMALARYARRAAEPRP